MPEIDDMTKIADKIQKSRVLDKAEKDSIIPELDKWLSHVATLNGQGKYSQR
jgi:hypothetical protein